MVSVLKLSRSPKAGHNKAGRSDFQNQRFEPDVGKMRKVSLHPKKQGSEEILQTESMEDAENANTKTLQMWKLRLTGFSVNCDWFCR